MQKLNSFYRNKRHRKQGVAKSRVRNNQNAAIITSETRLQSLMIAFAIKISSKMSKVKCLLFENDSHSEFKISLSCNQVLAWVYNVVFKSLEVI